MHAAAILLMGGAIAAVMLDAPRIAIAAAIPVLILNLITMEALRVSLAQLELR